MSAPLPEPNIVDDHIDAARTPDGASTSRHAGVGRHVGATARRRGRAGGWPLHLCAAFEALFAARANHHVGAFGDQRCRGAANPSQRLPPVTIGELTGELEIHALNS